MGLILGFVVVSRKIRNFMLGGEVSHIFNFGLGFFNFQCSGMISTSSLSFSVMINCYGGHRCLGG